MHSGPPATMTHRKACLPLPRGQAKHVPTKANGPKRPRFEGREGGGTPVKGPSKFGMSDPGLDFPIAVMAHSPRIG